MPGGQARWAPWTTPALSPRARARYRDRWNMMKDLNSLWDAARQATVPREVDVPHETLEVALERAAELWPDQIAIDFLGATTTYAQLASKVSRAASLLRERGVRKGDRVAIALPNCTTHIVTFNAVLRLGAIVVS